MPQKFVTVASQETTVRFILALALVFFLVNVSLTLGVIYLAFLLIGWNVYQDRRFISFPTVARKFNFFKSISITIVAFSAFLLTATVISGFFGPVLSVKAVVGELANTFKPVLAGSKILNFIGIGIIGPIIETRFASRLMEFLSFKMAIPLKFDLLNPSTHFMIAIMAAVFTLFHISAKLATGDLAFAITFLFFFFTGWLILFTRQTLEAVKMHVLNNSIVMAVKQAILVIT